MPDLGVRRGRGRPPHFGLSIKMRRAIGVTTADQIATGLVEGHKLIGKLRVFEEQREADSLLSMPAARIAECIAGEIAAVAEDSTVDAIGIGLPGIIRHGLVDEAPNLRQLK